MKKFVSLLLALCLVLAATAALADTTLVKSYTTEELTSNTYHNGFVTALGCVEDNTIVLKDDGTYEYTKEMYNVGEDGSKGIDHVYTFVGTYAQDGDTVVLAFPTSGSASENWGGLGGSYFAADIPAASFENSDYAAAVIQCKEEESHIIADLFESPYLLDTLTTSDAAFDAEECVVTITVSGDTFEYVISNSDDD